MAGFGKAIIAAMLAGTSLILFFNLAYFFPWYLTMVETGFTVSQMIATDNCLTYNNYDHTVSALRNVPIFDRVDPPSEIGIEAWHIDDGRTAIESSVNPSGSLDDYYEKANPLEKPYVQMGHPVRITVYAPYHVQMQLFGAPLDLAVIKFNFSMTTTTTKHYKDLEYEYHMDPSGGSLLDWNPDDWD